MKGIGGKPTSMDSFHLANWPFGAVRGVSQDGGRTGLPCAQRTSYEREIAGRACQLSHPWVQWFDALALATEWCMVGSHTGVLDHFASSIAVSIFLERDGH